MSAIPSIPPSAPATSAAPVAPVAPAAPASAAPSAPAPPPPPPPSVLPPGTEAPIIPARQPAATGRGALMQALAGAQPQPQPGTAAPTPAPAPAASPSPASPQFADAVDDNGQLRDPAAAPAAPTDPATSSPSPAAEIPASASASDPNPNADALAFLSSLPAADLPHLRDLATALAAEDFEAAQYAFLRTSRGERMRNAFSTLRAIERPPSEGGLGIVVEPEQVRDAIVNADQFENLRFGAETGDPSAFVQAFLRPDEQGRFQQTQADFLATLPDLLLREPETQPLYYQLAEPIRANTFRTLAREFDQMFPPAEQGTQEFANRAWAEWALKKAMGVYRVGWEGFGSGAPGAGAGVGATPGTPAAPRPSTATPLSPEAQELQRLRQEAANRQAAERAAAQQSYTSSFDQEVQSAVDPAATEMLASARTLYNLSDVEFNHFLDQFINEAETAAAASPILSNQVKRMLQGGLRRGFDATARQQAAQVYSRAIQQQMTRMRAGFVQKIGQAVKRGAGAGVPVVPATSATSAPTAPTPASASASASVNGALLSPTAPSISAQPGGSNFTPRPGEAPAAAMRRRLTESSQGVIAALAARPR